MILVDMSNLVFSQTQQDYAQNKEQPDLNLTRHIVVGALINQKKRLSKFGDLVLCFDARHYWRKEAYQYYKANRKAERDASPFDWNSFFKVYDEFKVELKAEFPAKYVEVDGAEADDTIAILSHAFGPHEPVCIVSSDKDFIQVQQVLCSDVKQWSLFHKKFLTPENTHYSLLEHIVRGDTGDGIPNILSDDDALVNPDKRQKPIMKKYVEECQLHGIAAPEKFCKTFDVLEHFNRNRKLIDFRMIPEEISQKVIAEYNNQATKTSMFHYLVDHRLSRLMG